MFNEGLGYVPNNRQLIMESIIDICGTRDLCIQSSAKNEDLQLRGVLDSKFLGFGP